MIPTSVVFSYPELWVATFTMIVAAAVAALLVLRTGGLEVRRVAPAAVTNGDDVEQEVLIINHGLPSGLVSLRDRVAEPMNPAGQRDRKSVV